jgi:hypothetical protein
MYNYSQALNEDIRDYIDCNINIFDYSDKNELGDYLNDELWTADSVTGNGSGSYTFNRNTARNYVLDNMGLLFEALDDFCTPLNEIGRRFKEEDWEYFDVTIRCYLLDSAISEVLDEMEEDGLLNFDEDEDEDEE